MNIPKEKIRYRCVRFAIYSSLLVSIASFANCKSSVETKQTAQVNQASPQPTQTEKKGEVEKIDEIKGFVLTKGIWANPVIPVCWESTPSDQTTERAWVQEAVENAWDANSNVDFTGWGLCEPHRRRLTGIRIAVIDTAAGASTAGLGTALSGQKNGIKLVFKYSLWNNKRCTKNEAARQSCIRANAVHEFGHGLAFAHEHRRDDTPNTCDAEAGGSAGDRQIGAWDANSIMNYCNTLRWEQSGALSPGDIAAVREIYGPKPQNTD